MRFSVDTLDWHGAGGWAFSPNARLAIEVWSEGSCVARSTPDRLRNDIASLFPGVANSRVSGFRAAYELRGDADEVVLTVVATEIDNDGRPAGERREMARKSVRNPTRIVSAFSGIDASDARLSPFPRGIEAAIGKLWPGAPPAHDEAGQRLVVDRLKSLAPHISGASSPAKLLLSYFRFLRAAWSHFQFVDKYFPNVNPGKKVTDTDWRCRPNSPHELLSIVHHLYVLKSHGVTGAFAEFGCFKGFSSSMLSYACALLGVKMHIFDSFAGLPRSGSNFYKEGDFAGSLEEVKRNVAAFGAPGVVEFHEGFFSQSVPVGLPAIDSLMTIWMDVDLFSSATDVMPVVGKLDPRGAIFSHECTAGHFDNGAIRPREASSENVVPAIVGRFQAMNAPLTGRYITGATGAFWAATTGVPVLANACLIDLVGAI